MSPVALAHQKISREHVEHHGEDALERTDIHAVSGARTQRGGEDAHGGDKHKPGHVEVAKRPCGHIRQVSAGPDVAQGACQRNGKTQSC